MIPVLDIIRVEDNFQYGVFGVLLIQREIFCVTLEPPEFENMKNVSCIPAGQYECERIVSPKHGTTYEIRDVPGRSGILFHAGNVKEHTEGCIILGEKFGNLGQYRAVLISGSTFAKFLNFLDPHIKLHLTIKEAWR